MTKELAMTPDAIRKRAKRASTKAVVTVVEVAQATTQPEVVQQPQAATEVVEDSTQIIKVGHALLHHRDGTVTKDSIWGIARIGKFLVKFYGRRGKTPRFRIERAEGLNDALALFELKKNGQDAKKLIHLELDAAAQAELLGADYAAKLEKMYFEAVVEGKVDRRAID